MIEAVIAAGQMDGVGGYLSPARTVKAWSGSIPRAVPDPVVPGQYRSASSVLSCPAPGHRSVVWAVYQSSIVLSRNRPRAER